LRWARKRGRDPGGWRRGSECRSPTKKLKDKGSFAGRANRDASRVIAGRQMRCWPYSREAFVCGWGKSWGPSKTVKRCVERALGLWAADGKRKNTARQRTVITRRAKAWWCRWRATRPRKHAIARRVVDHAVDGTPLRAGRAGGVGTGCLAPSGPSARCARSSAAGIKPQQVLRYYTGTSPTPNLSRKMAEGLGVLPRGPGMQRLRKVRAKPSSEWDRLLRAKSREIQAIGNDGHPICRPSPASRELRAGLRVQKSWPRLAVGGMTCLPGRFMRSRQRPHNAAESSSNSSSVRRPRISAGTAIQADPRSNHSAHISERRKKQEPGSTLDQLDASRSPSRPSRFVVNIIEGFFSKFARR